MVEKGDKDNKEDEETSEELGLLPPEIEKEIPEEIRPSVRRAMSMSMSSMRGALPFSNPLTEKLTGKHLDKIIDYTERDDVRQSEGQKSIRRYLFIAFCIIMGIFVGLAVFFKLQDDTTVLLNLIIAALALLGGFGGGFGVARYFQR